jgi:hypothetical protein
MTTFKFGGNEVWRVKFTHRANFFDISDLSVVLELEIAIQHWSEKLSFRNHFLNS